MRPRTVYFLGGIVRFELPHDWVETRDVGATGMYFADRDGSGTLRLSLLSMRPPNGDAGGTLHRAIAERGYRPFQTDLAMHTRTEDFAEADRAIRVRYYQVMFPVAPDEVRLAIFSFATYADETDEETQADIAVVERAIHGAHYSRLRVPEGDVQVFDALNASDSAWLEARRRHALGDAGTLDFDATIRVLEKRLATEPTDETFEAVGVVFGDLVAARAELEWQALLDSHGWSLCLGRRGTSIATFPIALVERKAQRGEKIDIEDLVATTVSAVANLSAEIPLH